MRSVPPETKQPSWPALVGISIISIFFFMACGLFSRASSVIPKPGAIVTAEVGKLAATLQAGSQTQGDQTPVAGSPEPAVVLQSALPRGFKYNNLTFSLQKAAITRQPPEGANVINDQGAYAQTIWDISNPTTDPINIDRGVFTLKLGDGTTATQAYDAQFASQDTKEVSIVFNVPAKAAWGNAQITFTEPDKEPAALPLEGDMPQAVYPQKLSAGGEAQVKVPALIYTIKEASVDLDGMGQRAGAGKKFVLFKVEATCKDQYDCYVGPESFRILVGGTPYSAQKIDPAAEAVKPDNSQTFRLAFEIQADAQQVELQVGEAGKDTAKIPINLENK